MELKFTKEEFKKLLELLDISEWVLTSLDVEEDERKYPYLKILQKIYKEAYEKGMTEEIEYDKEMNDYFPNEDWEEKTLARDFIEEYEDGTFWDELVFRLADRDIDRRMNGKPPKNFEEHVAMFTKIQAKYEEEFEKNNLENLEVVAKKAEAKIAKDAAKKVVKTKKVEKKSEKKSEKVKKTTEKKASTKTTTKKKAVAKKISK